MRKLKDGKLTMDEINEAYGVDADLYGLFWFCSSATAEKLAPRKTTG
ncbi:MAG: hypothetical protein VB875_19005 [Pirellulales bacterium]